MRWTFWLVTLCTIGILSPSFEVASEEASERARRAHAITRDVMSPYCPGRTLSDCSSPDAAALRAEIRELMAEGVDEREIRRRLESRFGDAILGVPRGRLGWSIPGLVLLAGAGVLVLALRRMSHAEGAEATPPSPERESLSEEELDRELRL